MALSWIYESFGGDAQLDLEWMYENDLKRPQVFNLATIWLIPCI